MRVSVIIPTCNRAEVLGKALSAYAQQSGRHQVLELIVVDDGSTDNTRSIVEEHARAFPFPLRYLCQENRGAAAARNRGLRCAGGDIILFGDDDVIPDTKMVAEHLSWHEQHSEPWAGMLGYVTWSSEVRPTPFMVWSGLYGPQFKFGYLEPDAEVGFLHAYTCNLSFKSAFVKSGGLFNESIPGCGWEDVEFAYRLYREGCRITYNPRAFGYHYKFETFDDTRRRIERWNRSWPLVAKTDFGAHLITLWSAKAASAGGKHKAMKNLVKPLILPLLRRLVDTRIPLPGRFYDMLFSYYVPPMRERASAKD